MISLFEKYKGNDTVEISPCYMCSYDGEKIIEEYFSYQTTFPATGLCQSTTELESFDFNKFLKYFMTLRVGVDDYTIDEVAYTGLGITYKIGNVIKEVDIQVTINGIVVKDEDLKKIFKVVEN